MHEEHCFIEAIECLSKRWSYSTDGAYCNFPDMSSPLEEEHFEGAEFSYGFPSDDSNTVLVSEAECSKQIHLACQKYLETHLQDASKIYRILANSSLQSSNPCLKLF